MGEQSGSPDYDDLVWGNGPVVLDVFIEPTCPFCGRAFAKFPELLARAGEDRLTLRLWMQSQPWHNFSGPVVRAVLAATGPGGGKEAAWEVMAAIFAHREDFVLVEHRTGPNLDLSPAGILRRIGEISGRDLKPAFEAPGVTNVIKAHARHGRRLGIHVSPTFVVDGVRRDDMGSGDDIGKWLADLGLT